MSRIAIGSGLAGALLLAASVPLATLAGCGVKAPPRAAGAPDRAPPSDLFRPAEDPDRHRPSGLSPEPRQVAPATPAAGLPAEPSTPPAAASAVAPPATLPAAPAASPAAALPATPAAAPAREPAR